MSALTAREGYRLWAPTYSDETAISHLDDRLAEAMTPPLDGLRLLDAGCGTGRRLRGARASVAVGVDLSPEMIEAGPGHDTPGRHAQLLIGDVRALPLPDGAFDVVWCRLVIGHLPDCAPAYVELARVADVGATVIVTDFHPQAHAAGHRRTFRTGAAVHELEHHVHEVEAHLAAARAAGLAPVDVRDAQIGPSVRGFYEKAGRLALYQQQVGLPVVIGLAFRREA